jgi:hypothetical protein
MATNTFVSTNYNGDLNQYFYEVLKTGINVFNPDKAIAHMIAGVRKKTQLDRAEYTTNPLEDYATGAPGFASGMTKEKRDVEPKKMTLSGTIQPDQWLADWDKYAPNGNLTNIMTNPELLSKIIDLAKNAMEDQLARLFWQGDVLAGGASPLRFFDGIITRLIADSDSDVTFLTPQGVIDDTNIVARLVEMYQAIPDKYLEDINYKIHCSVKNYKDLQLYNNDVKKSTVGVLDENIRQLFLEKRIVPSFGFPNDHLVGARTALTPDSNFVMATYFDWKSEFNSIQIDKVANLGKVWGYRVDFMADTQYRHGGDVVLYKPV